MVKYFRGDIVGSWFEKRLEMLGISPTPAMMERFAVYHDFLMQKNQVMNLTAITDRDEVYKKHFLDSLYLTRVFSPSGKTLLDVGSGAGFPAFPLKIVFPDLKVTVVDSLDKRIRFLSELSDQLQLEGITLIHGRAEELSQKNTFDLVTARAVARLNVLTELCLPFVKAGGAFVAMKAPGYEEELKEALSAIRILGGSLEDTLVYPLDEETDHVLIVIRKTHPTDPRYPRSFSQIKKTPL
jgi:16S rRNA (guanine527-N7)-methyltransferase